jgi:EPS-associated MarR family transcriptional regulator
MSEQTVAPASPAAIPPAHGDSEAARLAVLRLLASQPELSQRELSLALGLSLGKTHYVLHALLDKGLVKAGNFRRSDHKLAYAYVLTPTGLREKLRLTHAFLARKEAEFIALKATIVALKSELGQGNESKA